MARRKPPKPVNRLWQRHQELNGRIRKRDYRRTGKVSAEVFDGRRYINALRKAWSAYDQDEKLAMIALLQRVAVYEHELQDASQVVENSANAPYAERIAALSQMLGRSQQYARDLNELRIAEEDKTGDVRRSPRLDEAMAQRRRIEVLLVTLRTTADDGTVASEKRHYLESTSGLSIPPNNVPRYHGYHYLGHGAQAVVGYWEADPHGNPGNRVAVKDVYCDDHTWSDPVMWRGDANGLEEVEFGEKVPMEVYALSLLDSRAVVKSVGWRLVEHRMMYRLYLEYCPHGDLCSVFERYESRLDPKTGNGPRIPEPYLWLVFESLAEAGVAMQYRIKGNDRDDDGDHTLILHLDIKPENIFLGDRSAARFPAYPEPKLGDFGVAIETWPNDYMNPFSYNRIGTAGFRSPEVFLSDQLILGAADVWSIGITLMSLMEIMYVGAQHFVPGREENWSPQWILEQTYRFYSDPLRDLVMRCIRPMPGDRINVLDLLAEIRRHTDDAAMPQLHDRAEGMRTRTLTQARTHTPQYLLQPQTDNPGIF